MRWEEMGWGRVAICVRSRLLLNASSTVRVVGVVVVEE
jgi:hypothetical protein